ncbi:MULTISPECIES: AAA family ATPase [Vibrio]|uniref:AAA family ATPase n=1 Tax=Vibrio TaxID=662 RepID=UPI0004DF032F|nr:MULTISPECIES: AAA family ATPase [Vibrio]MDF4613640.1 AAA family ATPase [Vibrio parahaemolyticus]
MNVKSKEYQTSKDRKNIRVAAQPEIKKRITQLLEQIGEGLHEREHILSVSLLSTLSGQNTFLFGPPGTAKSLISRRLACAFESPKYYEHLMNRFTTPEEVFGPVSIQELKQDKYIRKTEGYLPDAEFAFLDEIWKSSPAILNTLLTLINEHVFKNGSEVIKAPIRSVIGASNEVPQENQGLDALYDRFITRLMVPPIVLEDNFNLLLNAKPSTSEPNVDEELRVSLSELSQWNEAIHNVELSKDTLLVIKYIRNEISEKNEELGLYVSDRRWQKAAILLKASAFFNERNYTNLTDTILIKHCLWTSPENRVCTEEIVMDAIESCGIAGDINLAALDNSKDSLEKEITKELFYKDDVYDVISLGSEEYFKVVAKFREHNSYSYGNPEIKQKTVHIPFNKFKSNISFHPVDMSGNDIKEVTCEFDEQGSCTLSYNTRHYRDRYNDFEFTPSILFHKGDKRSDVNERLIKSLSGSVGNLRGQLKKILKETEDKLRVYKLELHSPFTTSADTDVALKGVLSQIDKLKIRIKDCERLEALCQ